MVMATTFNVYVTGFGPFPNGQGGHFHENASHEVTKRLPSLLPAKSALNPTASHINIINPTAEDGAYVRTEYAYVRDYVRRMHSDPINDSVDLFLHLGMADGWHHVTVERAAYKQTMTSTFWGRNNATYYTTPDNTGRTVHHAGPCPWDDDIPTGLSPQINVDAVAAGAQALLNVKAGLRKGPWRPGLEHKQGDTLDVIPHSEAGTYCCGFIFFESLANRYKLGKNSNVLFCHVPGETDSVSLEKAKDAIVAVIVSAASQLGQV